ncbi:MAG: HAD family hydrolase [Candidatus Thorarchaeota archaeon]|nr:HAD family hydrolase [Candidatus Thorarchaeota archaeon]
MIQKRLESIKAVIFDLGDTLYTLPYSVDDYHMRFLREVCGDDFTVSYSELDRAHDAAEAALDRLIEESATSPDYALTTDEWILFDRILLENLGVKENIDEKSRKYQQLWDRLITSQPNKLRPGAKELLEELGERGFKMGIASNWDQSPHDLLSDSGIRHFFQSLQWTLVKGYAKPSPYMLIMNAYELGVNPLRCTFVGNKENLDVEAARKAGMLPIWLNNSAGSSSELREDTLIISELRELLNYLPLRV